MSIKVVTVNINGVRAAFRKGMAEWIAEANADIIALQEVRAETKDLVDLFATTGEDVTITAQTDGLKRKQPC